MKREKRRGDSMAQLHHGIEGKKELAQSTINNCKVSKEIRVTSTFDILHTRTLA